MAGTAVACSREAATLGEGPRWDGERGELLWVDILGSRVYRAVPAAEGHLRTVASYDIGVHVGAVAPAAAGGWLLAAGAGFRHLAEDGSVTVLAQPEAGSGGSTRMNDAVCDPQGRMWAGTMAYAATPGAGRLHRLDLDGTVTTVLDGLTISNGLGWSPDGATLYLADSGPGTVDAFDFAAGPGELSGRRRVYTATEGQGVGDGLTVDAEGMLWVAFFGGSALRRITPGGEVLETVRLPVSQPTAPCLGGDDGHTLFLTSARDGLDPAALAAQPDAGRVLRLHADVPGPPVSPFRGRVSPTSSPRG